MKKQRWMKTASGIVNIVLVVSILNTLALAAEQPAQMLSHANPRVREVIAVQEEVTPDLMSLEDVLGTAVGQDSNSEPTILVYVNLEGKNPAKSAGNIPGSLRGKRITVKMTKPFRALATLPSQFQPSSGSHNSVQTPPVQLGTSGGWSYDSANGYCCGGTLGSLIQIDGGQYILSNYHVFEQDVVPGGNNRVALTGDPIIHPGLIDAGCNAGNARQVATLVKRSSILYANVDASIAPIVSGMVRTDGSILEIGRISSRTAAASLSKAV